MKHVKEFYRRKCPGSEYARFRVNWIVIFVVQTIGVNFFIILPSLHQFVTSSSSKDDGTNNPRVIFLIEGRKIEDYQVEPGLDLSETWYSWIISISSVGELVGALTMGVSIRRTHSKLLLLAVEVCIIAGGILYGVGRYGWMLLLSRFLVGVGLGGQQAFYRVYISESASTAERLLPDDKKKGTLKYTLFFFSFVFGTASIAVGPGLSAIAAQLPIDQFRWSGWFLCFHSCTLSILILVFFRERWSDIRRADGVPKTQRWKCPKLDLSSLPLPWYTIVLIIVAFFTSTWFFAIMETLQNPLLADNFGLSIKYSSYIILASSALYATGAFVIYFLQRIRVSNRIICLCGFILLVISSLVMSDLQSIGGDPCVSLGELGQVRFSNGITVDGQECGEVMIGEDTLGYLLETLSDATPPSPCLQQLMTTVDNSTIVCQLSSNSTSNLYTCYWPWGDIGFMMELHHYEVLFNESLYSDKECSDPVVSCGCTSQHECDYMLLVMELESIEILEIFDSHAVNRFFNTDVEFESCLDNSTIHSQCVCESFNAMPGYECFWNPQSRVTGQYCQRCLEACRSIQHSLNFVQTIIGLCMIGFGYPITRIMLTILLSDSLGDESQGVYMGLLVASGSLSRLTGPLWGNPAYIAGGRRTWLPMIICFLIEVIVIVFYLLLYRTMKPKQTTSYSLLHDVHELNGDVLELVPLDNSVELTESASESNQECQLTESVSESNQEYQLTESTASEINHECQLTESASESNQECHHVSEVHN